MKALSIQQPWAWAILAAGKDIENRTWPTKFRGWFLIHASKTIDPDGYEFLATLYPSESNKIEKGGIIGVAKLVDCVTASKSKWFDGPFGFVLAHAMPINYYECRGHLGFFNIDLPAKIRKIIRDKVFVNTFEEI